MVIFKDTKMFKQRQLTFSAIKLNKIDKLKKIIVISLSENSKLNSFSKEINTLTGGLVERVLASATFVNQKLYSCLTINFPRGLCSDALIILKIEKRTKIKMH